MISADSLKKAVYKTLVYSSLFDFPLTSYEVYRYLIELKIGQGPIRNRLPKLRGVFKKEGYFFIGSESDLVARRIKRKSISQKKWLLAKKTARLLSVIPTIEMIGITGGLAMENADEEDDIDFLIITSPGLLWVTRFFATVLLDLLGIRRKPGEKNVKDLMCLNMFLDKRYASVSDTERNIYLAHEVLQVKPLLNRRHTYEYFLGQNKWTEKFLPNLRDIKNNNLNALSCSSPGKLSVILSIVFYPIEYLFYFMQKKYMEKKMTSEKISPHQIQFHPGNLKGKILSKYSKKLFGVLKVFSP
ncbi:hypothetical protein A3D77_05405 [Candidatus Gottesmanbacteria bacterium RIFCSPHIGHO2_02_FULL_39_11]|uniref:Polymerase nucleotidyl transferase domain-containing protein n=1 Tax=Candidatus Gottesmanbacteria bacterium RIFCSPHIGHO2_02_FULL_39_11 TaxID=1798382 RepID=A0A1F5ZLG5_9BACT|nr:MAG: hypothetical protein A3D77_05405 [Candidatus Gottesmanbacteria bacterium RIFCSPHIGHO2_02_FULL_39_11]